MPLCRLCHQDRTLRRSHIIPEFLFEDLYNAKHQMIGIHGLGVKGWIIQQKGIREPLFCERCEQFFNEHFEKPFQRIWVENFPLPDPWPFEEVHWIKIDYEPFKLFHLSVLFRASVSALPTFADVSLGPHEERLRNILLARRAGPEDQYPVFGYAVVHHQTRRIVQLVSKFQAGKFDGRRCYGVIYGGVQWWISSQQEVLAVTPHAKLLIYKSCGVS